MIKIYCYGGIISRGYKYAWKEEVVESLSEKSNFLSFSFLGLLLLNLLDGFPRLHIGLDYLPAFPVTQNWCFFISILYLFSLLSLLVFILNIRFT